jgi:hypothetical protein
VATPSLPLLLAFQEEVLPAAFRFDPA